MEFKFEYEPVRFIEMLSEIRTNFPLLEESAGDDAAEYIAVLLARLDDIKIHNFKEFALSLKSSELELIVKLMKVPAKIKTEVLEDIIKLRFRKKLFYLCWYLQQDDCENAGLINAARLLSELMKSECPVEYADSFHGRTEAVEGSLPEKGIALLIEEKTDIMSFCSKYSITASSVFAKKLRELFFARCDAHGFLHNEEPLLMHMTAADADSAAAVFGAYLDKLKATEYFDTLIYLVIDKWGSPEDGGELWKSLDDGKTAKFKAWQDLKKIERHFGYESKRFSFWAGYFDRIQRVEADEAAGYVLMEFENFVILDVKEEDGGSYLYAKARFVEEYQRYRTEKHRGAAGWSIDQEQVANARDLVIDGTVSHIYSVGYDSVHILYLKDILSEAQKDGTFTNRYSFMH